MPRVLATATGAPALPTTRAMLQTMLADRFKLVLGREVRPRPIYGLVVADDGVGNRIESMTTKFIVAISGTNCRPSCS
jgi:uncharacterized protein (TIGR03435 family)